MSHKPTEKMAHFGAAGLRLLLREGMPILILRLSDDEKIESRSFDYGSLKAFLEGVGSAFVDSPELPSLDYLNDDSAFEADSVALFADMSVSLGSMK